MPSEVLERERVPCPNPRLAKEETSLRMVSIGVEVSSMFGFDNPNNSQRIFGLYDGRTLFLPGLPPLHPPEIFICDSFCHALGSLGAPLRGRAGFPSLRWSELPLLACWHSRLGHRRGPYEQPVFQNSRAGDSLRDWVSARDKHLARTGHHSNMCLLRGQMWH